MINDSHQISKIHTGAPVDRTLRVEYGYIIDIMRIRDQSYYIAVVARENSIIPADADATVVPLEHSIEYLTSTYGSPEDVIGLRVRVEYFGENWDEAVGRIVPSREPQGVGGAMEVQNQGFRHAIAGGGSV